MRTIGKLIVAGVFVFAVLQVVRPSIPVKPATAKLQIPPDVQRPSRTTSRRALITLNCEKIALLFGLPVVGQNDVQLGCGRRYRKLDRSDPGQHLVPI